MKKLSLAALVLGVVLSNPASSDWNDAFSPSQGDSAMDPAVAYLSSSIPVSVYSRVDGKGARIFALLSGTVGPVLADEGIDTDHRRPVLVPDKSGGAALVYSMFTGNAWRIYARRLENGAFTAMNSGNPVDAGVDRTAMISAGAYLGDGRLVITFQQATETRPAIYSSVCTAGTWTLADPASPIDDATAGRSGWVAMAAMPDGSVVAAYTQEVDGDMRLFAISSSDGTSWSKLNGGAALDRNDLANPSRISCVSTPDGSLLVAYLEEDADGIQRVYAVRLKGAVAERVNAGAALDSAVTGVNSVGIAHVGGDRVLVVYGTGDQTGGDALPAVRSLLIEGAVVRHGEGWGSVQAEWEGSPSDVAVAGTSSGKVVAFYTAGGDANAGVKGRNGDFTVPSTPSVETPPAAAPVAGAAPTPAGTAEVVDNPASSPEAGGDDTSSGSPTAGQDMAPSSGKIYSSSPLFKPGQGEALKVVTQVDRGQRVRIALYTISGSLVRVLEDGQVNSGAKVSVLDGRNGGSEKVASGVYLLVAQGETFRSINKVVVIR